MLSHVKILICKSGSFKINLGFLGSTILPAIWISFLEEEQGKKEVGSHRVQHKTERVRSILKSEIELGSMTF